MYLLGKNEEINQWLSEHPGVLGTGAIVLGLILLGIGVVALITGRATSKYGTNIEGGTARLYGVVLAVFGSVCVLFGLFKVATAVL